MKSYFWWGLVAVAIWYLFVRKKPPLEAGFMKPVSDKNWVPPGAMT